MFCSILGFRNCSRFLYYTRVLILYKGSSTLLGFLYFTRVPVLLWDFSAILHIVPLLCILEFRYYVN